MLIIAYLKKFVKRYVERRAGASLGWIEGGFVTTYLRFAQAANRREEERSGNRGLAALHGVLKASVR